MDESEFDAAFPGRPFGTGDGVRWEAQARRTERLALALWGRSAGDLQRQLLSRYPEIPPGFELADFHELYRTTRLFLHALNDPKRSWLHHYGRSGGVVFVGDRQFSEWEARCEIVRRAIEFLELR
jgi:hypothetical protein